MSVLHRAIMIFLLKFLLMSNMVIICHSIDLTKPVDVVIINNLKNNLDLGLHCKSDDDDLGSHWLRHASEYSFHFKLSVWGKTQFYCHFEWQDRSEWFDIFIQHRDSCQRCVWVINDTGPCLLSLSFEKSCFNWNR